MTGNPSVPSPRVRNVVIAAEAARLDGVLTLPANAAGLVLFAHGSGSSRHSPRNTYVAGVLNEAGNVTRCEALQPVVVETTRRVKVGSITVAPRLTPPQGN